MAHSCPSLVTSLTVSQAAAAVDMPDLGGLAEAWQTRHRMVDGEAQPPLPAQVRPQRKLKMCWEENFCVCTGDGRFVRQLWNSAMVRLKPHCHADKKLWKSGAVALLWLGFALPDGRPDGADAPLETFRQHVVSYVPLMYLKPWRPTFMAMQALMVDNGGDDFEVSNLGRDAYVTLTGQPPCVSHSLHSVGYL